MSEEAVDLIQNLLKVDPAQRLGTGKSEATSFAVLKSHPYFNGISFNEDLSAEAELASYFDLQSPVSTPRIAMNMNDNDSEEKEEMPRHDSPLDLEIDEHEE